MAAADGGQAKSAMTSFSRIKLAANCAQHRIAGRTGGSGAKPQALLQRYKCSSCHADRETKTGPAYVDVAARYRGDPKALATLTAAVKQGSHGAGQWHMPPHPEVSDADARKMVRVLEPESSFSCDPIRRLKAAPSPHEARCR